MSKCIQGRVVKNGKRPILYRTRSDCISSGWQSCQKSVFWNFACCLPSGSPRSVMGSWTQVMAATLLALLVNSRFWDENLNHSQSQWTPWYQKILYILLQIFFTAYYMTYFAYIPQFTWQSLNENSQKKSLKENEPFYAPYFKHKSTLPYYIVLRIWTR